jgi:hypothetical protein
MSTPLRPGLLGVIVVLAALLAACGGDDDGGNDGAASDAERPYVDAIIEDVTEDEEFAATEQEAACFGLRIVRLFGADELEDRGITPEEYAEAESLSDLDLDVPEDAADQVSAALTDCYDDLSGVVGEGLAAQVGADAECLTENLDEAELADALAGRFIEENEDSGEALARAVFADLSPACAEQLLIGGAVDDGSIPEGAADCIAGELDDGVALRILQVSIAGGTPEPKDATAFRQAASACG